MNKRALKIMWFQISALFATFLYCLGTMQPRTAPGYVEPFVAFMLSATMFIIMFFGFSQIFEEANENDTPHGLTLIEFQRVKR